MPLWAPKNLMIKINEAIFIMCYTLFTIASTWLMSWLKTNGTNLSIGLIQGIISGLIVYLYVIRTENRRERRNIQRQHEKEVQEIKEKCSTALLGTQMTITFQMSELKGVEEICYSIMNFKLYEKSLFEHLGKIKGISGKAAALNNLINKHGNPPIAKLVEFAHYLIIAPPVNNIITLPQVIFSLLPIKLHEEEFTVGKFANYFIELASCNRKYKMILSLVERHNVIRDKIINHSFQLNNNDEIPSFSSDQKEFEKIIEIICARLDLAITLKENIEHFLNMSDMVFIQTEKYIQLLGITSPILVARQKDNKPVFDRRENMPT